MYNRFQPVKLIFEDVFPLTNKLKYNYFERKRHSLNPKGKLIFYMYW